MRKNPGLEGQRQGREAEETIAEAFNAAGWGTFTSPEHDYAHKTDVVAICPNGEVFNVQVSVNPKSKRQTATLKKRDVVPISLRETTKRGVSPTVLACARCAFTATCLYDTYDRSR